MDVDVRQQRGDLNKSFKKIPLMKCEMSYIVTNCPHCLPLHQFISLIVSCLFFFSLDKTLEGFFMSLSNH